MTKRIYTDPSIASSEITPEAVFLNRRNLIKSAAAGVASATALDVPADAGQSADMPLSFTPDPDQSLTAERTPYDAVTSYNNFYEFGTDKSDPGRHAHAMTTDPWTVTVGGLVEKPGELHLEDVLSGFDLQERIYRFRCVEAWSMVVPWIGFPLSELLARVGPRAEGRYVEFKALYRPGEMRGTRSFTSIIDWPYQEGLRLDEAMHPLALMAVGLYGKTLPNQNGAPLRLVVPWKYGFKSIKSIVEIRVTDKQPATSWQQLQPSEYGFYANVNPEVDHPRWSQRFERRLPSSIFKPNRVATLPFNGYAEQVADLYKGMDLRQFY
ncbi:protein-methionine-sulfoxide reductase catalytic subunit MsrP [Luminiphilus sp.]|nr:protein-methionine-sulfoxide reductase catalytic subunit MsrP [Luminiphilus sp.]MDA9711610.1 protein-methionine-sulfoxide reductase catalytic subunit MsrP [Luminiphilus sp.]